MPKRNEISSFEVVEAMRIQKRQARASIAKTALWWLVVIASGFVLGLTIRWMQIGMP